MTKPSDGKPREFWLTEHKEYDQWSAHDAEQYDTDIHVIEHQAYQEMADRVKELELKLDMAIAALERAKIQLDSYRQNAGM